MISRSARESVLRAIHDAGVLSFDEVWAVRRIFADGSTDYVVDPNPRFDYAEVFADDVIGTSWKKVRF